MSGPEQTADASPRATRPWWPTAVIGFLVVVVLGAGGVLVAQLASLETDEGGFGRVGALFADEPPVAEERGEVLALARQFYVELNTYDPAELDENNQLGDYRERITALISPKFKASFDQEVVAADATAQAGVGRTAEVYGAGVESIDGDTARVLVGGAYTVSFPSVLPGPEPQPGDGESDGAQPDEVEPEADPSPQTDPTPRRNRGNGQNGPIPSPSPATAQQPDGDATPTEAPAPSDAPLPSATTDAEQPAETPTPEETEDPEPQPEFDPDSRVLDEPRLFRIFVNLVRIDGEWLVDDFEPVQSEGGAGSLVPNPEGGSLPEDTPPTTTPEGTQPEGTLPEEEAP